MIAKILGVSADLSDTFTGWVRDVLEFADDPDRRARGVKGLIGVLPGAGQAAARQRPVTTC